MKRMILGLMTALVMTSGCFSGNNSVTHGEAKGDKWALSDDESDKIRNEVSVVDSLRAVLLHSIAIRAKQYALPDTAIYSDIYAEKSCLKWHNILINNQFHSRLWMAVQKDTIGYKGIPLSAYVFNKDCIQTYLGGEKGGDKISYEWKLSEFMNDSMADEYILVKCYKYVKNSDGSTTYKFDHMMPPADMYEKLLMSLSASQVWLKKSIQETKI